jgi:hypothetical protein
MSMPSALLTADAEAEDHPPAGRVGGHDRRFGTKIGKPQIDMGDPGADLELAGRQPHQLCRGDRVDVDLGAEDGLETGIFGSPRDVLDLAGSRAIAGSATLTIAVSRHDIASPTIRVRMAQ